MQLLVRARVALLVAALGLMTCGVAVATEAPAATPAFSTGHDCSGTQPYRVPEPGSTGIPAGLAVCSSGPIRVTEAGTVLDGWHVRGGIDVEAPDVVVRRSRVTGDGHTPFGVRAAPGASVRIEDTTFNGDFPGAAIGGGRWTGERIEVSAVTYDGAHLGDGARLRNSLVQVTRSDAAGLVVHGLDALAEDNTIEAAPGAGSAVRVTTGERGLDPNTQDADATRNSGAAPNGGAARGAVVVRGNRLGGGRYTLYEDVASGGLVEVRITGNRFGRDAGEGPLRVSPRAVISDNTFVDGAPLPRP